MTVLVDTNFNLLVYSSQYLSHLLHSLMRHRLEHLKIKFVSTHSIGKKPYCNNCLSRQRYYVYDGTVTGFILFWAFQLLFPGHFRVFYDLKFSCHLRKLSKSSFFLGIFWQNFPEFYFVLGTRNNLRTKRTIIFHDQQLNSMPFQAWKLKYFNSMTFQQI